MRQVPYCGVSCLSLQVSDPIPWTAAGPSSATLMGALDWMRVQAADRGKPDPLIKDSTSPPSAPSSRQPEPDSGSPADDSAGSRPTPSFERAQPSRSSPPRTRWAKAAVALQPRLQLYE
jgi:hypothetical protein